MQLSLGVLFAIPPMYIIPAVLNITNHNWGVAFLITVPLSLVGYMCMMELIRITKHEKSISELQESDKSEEIICSGSCSRKSRLRMSEISCDVKDLE